MPKTLTAREHWRRAFAYFLDGYRSRAIKAARMAMKLNPNLSRPHWILGQVYLSLEPIDREAAIKEFRELVRKDPRWPAGHAGLANALMTQGRKAEALKSIREVLGLNPKHTWAQFHLSKHLLERGEYREAIAVLLAKASAPHFCAPVDAYLLRAELLINSSRKEARQEWKYILTLDETIPANRVAQVEARKRLQQTEIL
jgi:tetratricopeptide (TPR) repeat protein